jgi:hypothetical protein
MERWMTKKKLENPKIKMMKTLKNLTPMRFQQKARMMRLVKELIV